jgi:hypothetical protein
METCAEAGGSTYVDDTGERRREALKHEQKENTSAQEGRSTKGKGERERQPKQGGDERAGNILGCFCDHIVTLYIDF